MENSHRITDNIINAWLIASKKLGFRIESPYLLEYDSVFFECIGYLPDFGSSNGMIIDGIGSPAYESTTGLSEVAESIGLYYSSINVNCYEEFDADLFKETLIDWGFYGDDDYRPSWIP